SARVAPGQYPGAARPPEPTAAMVRRAERVASKPRTGRARSTRNGPHSTAALHFFERENSASRKICTEPFDASTPLIKWPRLNRDVVFPLTTRRPSGAKLVSKYPPF